MLNKAKPVTTPRKHTGKFFSRSHEKKIAKLVNRLLQKNNEILQSVAVKNLKICSSVLWKIHEIRQSVASKNREIKKREIRQSVV